MPAAGSGPVAKRRKGRDRPPDEEDAFIRAINRAWAWAAQNTATVVVAAAFLAVLVGGFFWYRAYQQNREARAATQLQTIQARAAAGDTGAIAQLEGYLASFSGTEPARRARILLARHQLLSGRAGEAVSTVQPLVDETAAETPTGYASRSLLAESQAVAGDTAAALASLETLADAARFGFQRREAAARRARLLAARGRLAEAVAVYERIAAEAEGEEADRYRVRLGQLKARLASRERDGSGQGDGPASGSGAGSEG